MRKYAQVNVHIWSDDDFCQLTPCAQWLFFVLLSHPTLTNAGVGDWRPKRLAALSAGDSMTTIADAIEELQNRRYVIVDEDTEEYLIRSFPRNDGLMKMPNMASGLANDTGRIASSKLRKILRWELNRLKADQPDLKGWVSKPITEFMDEPNHNPKANPTETLNEPLRNPSPRGSETPTEGFRKGSERVQNSNDGGNEQGYRGGRVRGSDKGSVGGSPTPNTKHLSPSGGEVNSNQQGDTQTDPKTPSQKTPDDNGAANAAAYRPDNKPPANATPDTWSTPDDPRCRDHAGIPRDHVPPCQGCANVKKWFEQRERNHRQQQLTEIQNCPHCDQNGIYQAEYPSGRRIAIHCNHDTQPPQLPPEPEEFTPQSTPESRRAAIESVRTASKTQKSAQKSA